MDANVNIQLTRSVSNDDDPRDWRLEITDVTSGTVIGRIYLDAANVSDLVSARQVGGVAGVPAKLTEVANYAAVSQYKWHASLPLAFDYDGEGSQFGEDRLCNHFEQAQLHRDAGGTSFRIQRHNYGMTVSVRGHAETLETAYQASKYAAEHLARLARHGEWRGPKGGTEFRASHHPASPEPEDRY